MIVFLSSNFGQMLIALAAFVVVLVLTIFVTRWLGEFQKGTAVNKNIRPIETYRITNNKFIQILKIGDKYVVIGVCKDTMTKLAELTEEEIMELPEETESFMTGFQMSFGEIYDKIYDKMKDRVKKK